MINNKKFQRDHNANVIETTRTIDTFRLFFSLLFLSLSLSFFAELSEGSREEERRKAAVGRVGATVCVINICMIIGWVMRALHLYRQISATRRVCLPNVDANA